MSKFNKTIEFIKNLYPNHDFVPLHAPVFKGNEKKYVLDTIESTFVSSVGAYVNKFEDMMRDFTGAKHAIAVVNGTSALHISLKLVDVSPGDLVITQALSFVATCNAISYLGAEPAFVDVDKDTMGMNPSSLQDFFKDVEIQHGSPIHMPTGKKIAACVPMHTYGFPCKIDEIVDLCDQFSIPVVEDAAESLGSYYKDKHTGRFGKLGVFSFNGNKTITSGSGGIIITDDEKLGLKAKHLTTQAKVPHKWDFYHDEIGYNYRCSNLNSALACAQLEQIESIIQNKRETAILYKKHFFDSEIHYMEEPSGSRSNYWLNTIVFEDIAERDAFLQTTNDKQVMTRPVWKLMTELPMFKDCLSNNLDNSKYLSNRLVNIPSSVRE